MLAQIAGFPDPWERPLRPMPPERMKKLSSTEKEANGVAARFKKRKTSVEYTSFTLLVETVGTAGACLAGEPFSGSTLMRTASGDAARNA